MNKLQTVCALLAVSFLLLTSCDALGGNTDDNGDLGAGDGSNQDISKLISIAGKFGLGDVVDKFFTATEVEVKAGTNMRAVNSSHTVYMEGTLDDGDMTFRLKGFYDKETKAYSLAAASSMIKYTVGSDGTEETASVAVKAQATDVAYGAPVVVKMTTVKTGGDIVVTKEKKAELEKFKAEIKAEMKTVAKADVVEGLTETKWHGAWLETEGSTDWDAQKYIIDEWGIKLLVQDKRTKNWKEDGSMQFTYIKETEPKSGIFNAVVNMGEMQMMSESEEHMEGGPQPKPNARKARNSRSARTETDGYEFQEGFDPTNVPDGYEFPEGFDPTNVPDGYEFPAIPGEDEFGPDEGEFGSGEGEFGSGEGEFGTGEGGFGPGQDGFDQDFPMPEGMKEMMDFMTTAEKYQTIQLSYSDVDKTLSLKLYGDKGAKLSDMEPDMDDEFMEPDFEKMLVNMKKFIKTTYEDAFNLIENGELMDESKFTLIR